MHRYSGCSVLNFDPTNANAFAGLAVYSRYFATPLLAPVSRITQIAAFWIVTESVERTHAGQMTSLPVRTEQPYLDNQGYFMSAADPVTAQVRANARNAERIQLRSHNGLSSAFVR